MSVEPLYEERDPYQQVGDSYQPQLQGSQGQGQAPYGQPQDPQGQAPYGQPQGPQGQPSVQPSWQPPSARQGGPAWQQAPLAYPAGGSRVVESASATTSPDNANSGNAAYLIFGVAALVLTLMGVGLFGLLSSMMRSAADEIAARGGDHPISYDLQGNDVSYDDIVSQLQGEALEG